jgi:Domain of unknown function (DUF4145)
MVQIALDCPHCLAEKAAFSGSAFYPFEPGAHNLQFIMLMQCQVCSNGIVAKFQGPGFALWVSSQQPQANIQLVKYWPEKIQTKTPDHTPDNIRSFYTQGMDNLARKNFDAAGTMFRKSLDTALKRLDPSGKGTLQHRIENLPAALGITPAMKEWAHQIRELGNDAAHEEDPFTEDEAKALQAFSELFLTYTFTLPGMLAARKSPLAPASPPP